MNRSQPDQGKITKDTVEFMEGSAVASGFQMSHTTPPMDFKDADVTFMVNGSDASKGDFSMWCAVGRSRARYR